MPEKKQKPDRKQRLSDALRANLRKRKQQKRDKKLQKDDQKKDQNPSKEDKQPVEFC